MKLLELHQLLQNSILQRKPLIDAWLQPPIKGDIADRVAVYTDGFFSRLEEALGSDYSTLAAFIGDDEFSSLTESYLNLYPSCSYTLNCLGKNLNKFLQEVTPWKQNEYLAEIAQFEWAESQAAIAADIIVMTADDLQSLPPEDWPELRFRLHPSATIIGMHWNSLEIIEALRDDKSFPLPKKRKSQQSLLIWRRERDVRYCKLDQREFSLLQAIQSGASFMTICEQLTQIMPEQQVADFVAKGLHLWMQEKLLTSF